MPCFLMPFRPALHPGTRHWTTRSIEPFDRAEPSPGRTSSANGATFFWSHNFLRRSYAALFQASGTSLSSTSFIDKASARLFASSTGLGVDSIACGAGTGASGGDGGGGGGRAAGGTASSRCRLPRASCSLYASSGLKPLATDKKPPRSASRRSSTFLAPTFTHASHKRWRSASANNCRSAAAPSSAVSIAWGGSSAMCARAVLCSAEGQRSARRL